MQKCGNFIHKDNAPTNKMFWENKNNFRLLLILRSSHQLQNEKVLKLKKKTKEKKKKTNANNP